MRFTVLDELQCVHGCRLCVLCVRSCVVASTATCCMYMFGLDVRAQVPRVVLAVCSTYIVGPLTCLAYVSFEFDSSVT